MVRIKEVETAKELKQFIDLPYKIYKNNTYWAPPIRGDEREYLQKIPAIDTGIKTHLLLAKEGKKVVGRIQIILNENEIDFSGEKLVRFNKFDFYEDIHICRALLEAAEQWAINHNVDRIIGPFGYTNLDAAGLLVEGFDEISCASTIYNFPYYREYIEECGYDTYLEWLEHEFTVPKKIPEKVLRYSALMREKYQLSYAEFKTNREKKKWAQQILSLINICYAHLPGFVPLSEEIKAYYYKKYIPIINKDYISLVVDKDNNLIGFGLTLPSYTEALQKSKGSILPFGFYHLWKASRVNNRAEMLLIAIHPDYQSKGITSIIFDQILEKYIEHGIEKVESNPEQATNMNVRNLWREYHYRLHKKRICYFKDLL
ncbi:GNAT family N-acetyltransferase [Membranihabitans marinus]|uniref:GNAT family N-acetyltransferase n=1 Tax=Membranihabitans marinus TaxID=1227546 RepID=UPI001F0178DB|nr:GNAT family N-acetyltransferase [Membranihabitans marinus]